MANQQQDFRLLYGGQQESLKPSPIAPIMHGAGIPSRLYGGISANNQAEYNYALQQAQFQEESRRWADERKRLLDAQKLANIYSSANYSNELGQQNKPEWAQFFRQVRA